MIIGLRSKTQRRRNEMGGAGFDDRLEEEVTDFLACKELVVDSGSIGEFDV